jgi:hypothetical protein
VGLEVKERDSTVFKLGANDSFGIEAKAIAVKRNCAFQVIDAESDDCD